jgi:hypothetical protein
MACYAIRTGKSYVNQETLLMVYYAYLNSIMHCGIIFWENASYATNVLHMQKRELRITMGIGSRDSCRHLFKMLEILTPQFQYIYSLTVYYGQ